MVRHSILNKRRKEGQGKALGTEQGSSLFKKSNKLVRKIEAGEKLSRGQRKRGGKQLLKHRKEEFIKNARDQKNNPGLNLTGMGGKQDLDMSSLKN